MDDINKAGVVYVVATPIGNLEDITLRAIKTLKEVDFVVCEDTRVTKKLLNHLGINKPAISCFQHSKPAKLDYIVRELKSGKNIALVTDAGTPGVSDPGNMLVAEAVKAGINVIPIPGASALASLVSVSGINMQKFLFLAFPPHKKGRETFFKEVAASEIPIIYYESPHRVMKNLELLASLSPEKKIIVGREMTKMFEEILRGTPIEILEYFKKNKEKVRGEFAIIAYDE